MYILYSVSTFIAISVSSVTLDISFIQMLNFFSHFFSLYAVTYTLYMCLIIVFITHLIHCKTVIQDISVVTLLLIIGAINN